MLEARRDHGGKQAVGLAMSPGEEERDDRQLGDVELEIAHHALEGLVGLRDILVLHFEGRFHLSGAKRMRPRVVAEKNL